MRFLLEPEEVSELDELLAVAEAAVAAGFDGVYLAPSPALPAPLVAAASLAAVPPDLLVAVEVTLGDRNPVELAEEAAVVDLGLGGRLVLVVGADAEDPAGFPESLDLLRTALAARPFRWEGERWRAPANLAQNVGNPERRIRVTPAPLQPRLEVWGRGPAAAPHAIERGLGHVGDAEETPAALATSWAATEGDPAGIGAPRGRRHHFASAITLIAELADGRAAFGQDWAIVRGDADAAAAIGVEVSRAVQLDALPPGLADFWNRAEEPGPAGGEPTKTP